MKKKLLGAVLSVGAIVGLASCMEVHEHEFATDWSSNASGHWHACACDERLLDSFAAHVDENKDGNCDVCSYEVGKPHEHAYATEYSKDASGHWYDSTCDHKVVSGFAQHTEGEDGVCTACGYVVTAPSNVATLKSVDVVADNAKTYYNVGESFSSEGLVIYETYSNTLSDDTVSVGDVSKYSVKVVDASGAEVTGAFSKYGVYTVTVANGEISDSYDVTVGAKVYASASDALAEGLANDSKVNGGYISIDLDGYVQEFEYAFGENYTKIVNGTDEYHYELLEDGSVFGVNCYYDWEDVFQVTYVYEPGVENLLGAELTSVFAYEHTVFGVNEMLSKLVELSKSEAAANYKEGVADHCPICNGHSAYTFSFDVVMGEYSPANYTYEVAFSIDDASKAINNVEMKVSAVSYVYDEATDSYVPNVDAEPDYVKYITIQQEIGERSAENEYSADALRFVSFDLVDAEDNKYANNATIEAKVGEKVYLYIANANPVTANPNVDQVVVEVTTEDGQPTYVAGGSYDSYDGCIGIYSYKVGKYNVSISTANVTINYVLDVKYADLTEFAPGVYDQYGDKYEAYAAYTYANNQVIFGAYVNSNANPGVTATLAEEYEGVSLEQDGNDYIFSASAVGEYTVNLVSTVNSEFTASFTIYVEEAPNMADVINGVYTYDNWGSIVTFTFTPESEGALNGTLVINSNNTDYDFTYSYYEAFGALQVLAASPAASACEWSVGVENYELICLYYGLMNYGPLTKVEEDADNGEDAGDADLVGTGVQTDPYILTVGGSYSFATTISDPVYCAYIAEQNVTLVFDITSPDFWFEYGTWSFMLCDQINHENNEMKVTLAAGQTLFMKVYTNELESGVVSFSVSVDSGSSDNEGDSGEESDAVTVLPGFSPYSPAFLDKEENTYVATIGGGNSGFFGIFGDGTDYFISIEFDTNLTLYAGSPMAPMTYTSGSMISVSGNDGVLFWFDNSMNMTDAVVTFTISIYA